MTDRKLPKEPDHALSEGSLEALFEAARGPHPEPSGAAIARWVADAESMADTYARAGAPAGSGSRRPAGAWLTDLWQNIGGWRGGVGLATVALAGVVIGVNPPAVVDSLAGLAVADELFLVDVVPSFSDFGVEEG